MEAREWTIQTSNNEGLCLTRHLDSLSVNFDVCTSANKNQLWIFRDFIVSTGGGCSYTVNSSDG